MTPFTPLTRSLPTHEEINQPATILVVDDVPANLRLLGDLLGNCGYKVLSVPRGEVALQAAERCVPDLILLDINMPGLNGYEVCRRLKANPKLREIPVIFISALNEAIDKVQAFRCGGVDYVSKPFEFEEVQARVDTHLRLRRYQREMERWNDQLQKIVWEQINMIVENQEEIALAQMATITAMSKIAEARDSDTGKHIERTQSYCRALASELRKNTEFSELIDDDFVRDIYHASPLHDIGKVAVPDAILLKPARLTPEEFDIIKRHTLIGAKNLQAVADRYPNNGFIRMGIQVSRSHHERWNGAGYPDGLQGAAIPLSAQIMAVADVYDALRSKRVYKAAYSHEVSRDIIVSDTGTHFSPAAGEAFLRIEKEFLEISERLGDDCSRLSFPLDSRAGGTPA